MKSQTRLLVAAGVVIAALLLVVVFLAGKVSERRYHFVVGGVSVGSDAHHRNWERYKKEWRSFMLGDHPYPWDYKGMPEDEQEEWRKVYVPYIRKQQQAWLHESWEMGNNTPADFQKFAPPDNPPF